MMNNVLALLLTLSVEGENPLYMCVVIIDCKQSFTFGLFLDMHLFQRFDFVCVGGSKENSTELIHCCFFLHCN